MYEIRIGVLQLWNTKCVDDSRKKITENTTGLAQRDAQPTALQELHNSLYFRQVEGASNFGLAEPIPDPSTEFFGKLARELEVVIIASLSEKWVPDLYHNTAVVIKKGGTIAGKYRKVHIPGDPAYYEKFYSTPGDLGFHPIDTSIGRLDVLVYWDQRYLEATRLTALQGAQPPIHPTTIGYESSDYKDKQQRQRNAWMAAQRGHAVANGTPATTVNRVRYGNDPSG